MPARETATDVVTKSMNVIHKGLLKITGGRVGRTLFGMTSVALHTTGRRSGQRRTVMLTAPIMDDHRIVLVASKGGDDRHPDWYRNLVDDPNVEVTIGDDTKPMRARTASAEEKAELWPRITSVYKGYAGYQTRTERDIPVVILEPPA